MVFNRLLNKNWFFLSHLVLGFYFLVVIPNLAVTIFPLCAIFAPLVAFWAKINGLSARRWYLSALFVPILALPFSLCLLPDLTISPKISFDEELERVLEYSISFLLLSLIVQISRSFLSNPIMILGTIAQTTILFYFLHTYRRKFP